MYREMSSDYNRFFVDKYNRIQGKYECFYENGGKALECYYVDSIRNGEYKSFYRNGQISEHYYEVNGVIHGEYKQYDDNGTLVMHSIRLNGVFFSNIENDNMSEEERFLLTLSEGINWLSKNP